MAQDPNDQSTTLNTINRDFEERETQEKASHMGMSYVDLERLHINPDHLQGVPLEEARSALAMPFFRVGKKMRLAVVHPTATETLSLIRRLKEAGYAINVNLCSESGFKSALATYEHLPRVVPISEENLVNEEQIASYQKELETLSELKDRLSQVTAEEALNYIHLGAMKTGTSDIHYQPEDKQVLVRFRIDGVLQKVFDLPKETYKYICNQLKYKAGMKLNISNVPQDGRFFFKINDRKIDVRVSGIPTEFGESFVCRLLDPRNRTMSFEEMGFGGHTLELIKSSLQMQNGMILVTGPTGSGKTTTLYTLLDLLNKQENKIITLEDPIEYHLENITQSQINEKRGYSFAAGLRSILRQNPNIVMIGEIRDLETAETASQAALTGHLLLSTLHANSALETVARLQNIGLAPYMIAPALGLIIAQRLIRRVCPYCVKQRPVSPAEQVWIKKQIEALPESIRMNLKEPSTFAEPSGCEKCSHTGYLGQTVIAEALEMSTELREKILAEEPSSHLLAFAKEHGMITMKEDGITKALRGLTTFTELSRVVTLDEPVE